MTVSSAALAFDVGSGGLLEATLADALDQGVRDSTARFGATISAVDRVRVVTMARRFDAMLVDHPDVKARVQRRMQARADAAKKSGKRSDAFDATAGLFLARELEHRYSEILREPHPRPDAFELFSIDTSVPVGARTHTVSRSHGAGEVAVVREGQALPTVRTSRVEESFPVRHYATSVNFDIFELASADFANWPAMAEDLRLARDKIMEFANRMTWYGSSTHGMYGVTNYPWLGKAISSVNPNSASTDAQLAELFRLGNWSQNTSQEVYAPDGCVMATRLRNHFATTRLGSVNDTTILEFFLKQHGTIKEVSSSPFLQGAGPGSTDGILFYRRDRLGINNVIVQPFTTLPTERSGFDQRTIAYMSHGGVIMRDVGNNLLAWMTPPA